MKVKQTLTAIAASVISTSMLVAAPSSFARNFKDTGNLKGERMEMAPCPQGTVLQDGVYLGGQLGYNLLSVRQTSNLTDVNSVAVNSRVSRSPSGLIGGLFLGYGRYVSQMVYLGGEVFGNYSNASGNNTYQNAYYSRVSAYGSYGVSFLPGLKVNDSTLVYVRLGYNRVRLNVKESGTNVASGASNSTSNWSGGFQYGVGAETALAANWSVRGEFNHTDLSSFNSSLATATRTSFKPRDNQALLGVVYHFS